MTMKMVEIDKIKASWSNERKKGRLISENKKDIRQNRKNEKNWFFVNNSREKSITRAETRTFKECFFITIMNISKLFLKAFYLLRFKI